MIASYIDHHVRQTPTNRSGLRGAVTKMKLQRNRETAPDYGATSAPGPRDGGLAPITSLHPAHWVGIGGLAVDTPSACCWDIPALGCRAKREYAAPPASAGEHKPIPD